jgi:hypothetical protein
MVGNSITISFWLKQTTGAGSNAIGLNLYYANAADNWDASTQISTTQSFTTTTGWAQYSATFTNMPSGSTNGLQVTIVTNSGSAVVFLLTGVQLEVGSVATNFDYRSIGTELGLCQRYYEKSYNMGVVPGTNTGDGRVFLPAVYQSAGLLDYGGNAFFKVSKRANPTIAYWTEEGTSGSWNYATASGSGTLTPLSNRVGTTTFSFYATGSGFSNTAIMVSGHWSASIEL